MIRKYFTCLGEKKKHLSLPRAVLSPPRPPALQGGFNAVALTRSRRVGRGVICRTLMTHLTGICRSFFIPEFPEGEQSTVHPSPYIHLLSH